MTKLREPLTYQRTLTQIAAVIGWDRCAAICGVSERSVRNWSDPDCETEIRLIDAERLDHAFMERGGDHAPFHRLHALRLDLAARDTPDHCLVSVAGKAAKETGEAVAALITASGSGDPRARRRARKEVHEAIDSLTDGLASLDRAEQGDNV
ncbi:hypothetical protein [Novosphingobium sp. ST904]|uniref:hypothetical protein n=1 Tax=Novosphingobium sp. ST904 TaxID=1684385 RepID=UPI0006C8C847|nr:hypothetical protein [Novosphingobium sp. ST904]KPH62314.1 hypothetical protein ADT71_15345 [Novosphingobium sp. ST904]TCM43348.1 hypothetical protein EDF59_101452 [Novosphingobium sp. ST904]